MKSHTRSVKHLREIILLTLIGDLMYISQVVMSPLPNIELVSLLVIITAHTFGFKSLISVYMFVVCEIFTYGIEIWVINYMYIWAILAIVICCIRKAGSAAVYTLLSGIFGLLFGTLCSFPYFIMGGAAAGFANIIAGIWFDILHMTGNIVIAVLLYRPLIKVFEKLKKVITAHP